MAPVIESLAHAVAECGHPDERAAECRGDETVSADTLVVAVATLVVMPSTLASWLLVWATVAVTSSTSGSVSSVTCLRVTRAWSNTRPSFHSGMAVTPTSSTNANAATSPAISPADSDMRRVLPGQRDGRRWGDLTGSGVAPGRPRVGGRATSGLGRWASRARSAGRFARLEGCAGLHRRVVCRAFHSEH